MPRTFVCCLLAVLTLSACTGRSAADTDAEIKALRERVERLEKDAAEGRAHLADDVNALRDSLDQANEHLAALEGAAPPAKAGAETGQAGKSPRAALRQSLREVMDMARQALDRLNKNLESSLSRPKPQEPAPAN